MVATQACPTGRVSPAATRGYHRRRPSETVLYQAVQEYLETWLARSWEDPAGNGVPFYVERDFRKYLECGILAHGFARARCKECGHDFLIAFSCKGRGVCPACNTRRMAEIAAHLVDHVIPRMPVRQWVLSLPKRLRGFLHYDPVIAGKVLRILLQERLAMLIPPPRIHRHRYYGVLAPNAPLRAAVAAMVLPESAVNPGAHACFSQRETADESLSQSKPRSSSISLWAMLLARIYELLPLVCPLCGGGMEIISFITDPHTVQAILNHVGEPIKPPPIAPARGPPVWEMLDEEPVLDTAQPEPEYDFDQTLNW